MRTYPTKEGPFPLGAYYETHEIESICTYELRQAGFLPTEPCPIRIDRFIEKRFRVVPEYQELPESVLGYSVFGRSGVEAIVIASFLDEDDRLVSQRRVRTTLAHECGHVLLHEQLFNLADRTGTLFDSPAEDLPKVMCRDETGDRSQGRPGYDGRWWEFQANAAIGALLLPQQLVEVAVEPFLVRHGRLGIPTLVAERIGIAEQTLCDAFDVNPAVAKIRLRELFRTTNDAQPSL